MTEKRNRFPGAKPFTAEDKEVFYGREKDIDKLFELLRMKRMIVLYAESGIGKSSLVNAGLVPKYHTSSSISQFIAVKIRFGLSTDTDHHTEAVEILLKKITDELKLYNNLLDKTELPFVEEKPENSLWYQVKLFERNGIRLLLAFDQFEETFTYTNEQVSLFKEQLFSVFSGVPKGLNALISEKVQQVDESSMTEDEMMQLDDDLKFMYTALSTQILYIIREDKLGFFNSFTDYFPDILKDTYKLLPLNRSSGTEAISLPAGKAGNFTTEPFTFSQPALDTLLNRLAEKNGTYDPFTIQLMCRYIEKTLIGEGGKRQIEENEIPEVNIIVKDFISSAWKALPAAQQKSIDIYKERIEKRLIAADIEKRVSVHESDWINDKVVTVLINEGLLKRDRRGGVDYIELSHDRLIKPLLEDYKLRIQQVRTRQQRRRNTIVALSILAVIITAVFFIVKAQIIETDVLTEQKDSLATTQEKLRRSLATKSDIIEGYLQKENNDSAQIFTAKAKELVEKKEYKKADSYFTKAIAASFKADDNGKSDSIADLRQQLIPQTALSQALDNSVYKIDVFYDERTLPGSETTADQIIQRLEQNKAFVVRKKLLTADRISKNPNSWDIQGNIIRSERNKTEMSFSDSLVADFNKADFINDDKVFHRELVKSAFKTPQYISIFIHY